VRDVLEAEYLLLDTVFEDMKVLLAQIGEGMALMVGDDDIDKNKILFSLESIRTLWRSRQSD
jgi:hypothetical protein